MASNDISFTVFKGSSSGAIVESKTTHGPLTGDQVLVAITASGLCGTDIHYKKADMALGHEGVGVVKSTGPGVHHLRPGDRVGWGYIHDSCGECQQCLQGHETYCPERQMYGTHDFGQGSFGYAAVWREAFLFKIPDAISDEDAAPLMCGGATVWNALDMYDVRPTDTVGVLGVGGLGHLAIQFAAKMGCHTIVFSGTESKRDEAFELGASEFYATKGLDKLELKNQRKLDVLLVTTSALPDWKLYLPIMSPGATIFPLALDENQPLTIPYMEFLLNGLRLQASIVAPRFRHIRMLAFAAEHGIKPLVNRFALDKAGIEEAVKTLEEGKMRYRGVLLTPKESRL